MSVYLFSQFRKHFFSLLYLLLDKKEVTIYFEDYLAEQLDFKYAIGGLELFAML